MHDLETMAQLLVNSGLCENISGKAQVLNFIGVSSGVLSQDISAYNNDSFSVNLISALNEKEDRIALSRLLDLIEKKLPNEKFNIYSLRATLVSQNIHIITGTKGGIGKTLVALAIACHYYFAYSSYKKRLLAVDLNTTNPDLSRILSFYKNKNTSTQTDKDGMRSWVTASIDDIVHVTRPTDPHHIRGGASSFWDDVLRVCDRHKDVSDIDLLIDTSQHIANLVFGRQDITSDIKSHLSMPRDLAIPWETSVKNILQHSGRTIYIWVFWTWANFQDTEIDNITTPITRFNNTFGNRVSIIHVFNPSALLSPQIQFPPTKTAYRELIKQLYSDIERLKKETELDHGLTKMVIKNREDELNNAWEKHNALADYDDFEIPGLRELAREVEIVPPLPYLDKIGFKKNTPIDFRNLIANVFNGSLSISSEDVFTQLHDILYFHLKGCPSNILPISTLDPDLKGYTEIFAKTRPASLPELKEKISKIVEDIERFVPYFAPMNGIAEE